YDASVATSGRADLDPQRERDVGVQRHGGRVLAGGLDRVVEVDRLAIELDLRLRLHGIGDVGGGDRAEQLALGARLGGDGDDLRDERRGDRGGRVAVAGVAQVARSAHACG